MSKDHNRDDDSTKSVAGRGEEQDRPRISKLGHFRIESTLGSGGMGTIYRAYDESMKRPVALKVLHSSLEISSQAQSRFVREAWIAGQLDHPNIVKVYSRGEENKVSYLAMELAEGGSLSDYIKQTRESIPSGSDVTGTIDRDYINDILRKFVELAGALEHIHTKGFIHRDIKPHNILFTGPEKKFKLTDFGIAHAEDMTRMTKAGDFIGTVKYMSPELLAAHRAGIDRRTDIYSLGVTLYEALTLILPFAADSEEKLVGEILAGHYIEARKANRRVPVDLETVLMKACHHDPDLRYQTASAFADDMRRVIDGRPILAKRQGIFPKTVKYVKRNYKIAAAIVAAVAIMAVTILWSLSKMGQFGGPDTDRPKFTEIRIPTYPGNGVLSPDGERIAFCSDWTVWAVPLSGKVDPNLAGEPVRLSGRIGAYNYGYRESNVMDWSHDGKWIVFNVLKGDTTEMHIIPSNGGEAIVVPVERHPGNRIVNWRLSLSPDGKTVAYCSADEPGMDTETGDVLGQLLICTAPVAGGEVNKLTDTHSREPCFSPDGKKIAFIMTDPYRRVGDTTANQFSAPPRAVYVVGAQGGQPVLVADLPGWEEYPIWSPDSRMLAFEYESEEEHRDIRIVRVSANGAPVGDPMAVEVPAHDFMLAGWSTEGKIGICSWEQDRTALYTVPASGGRAVQVAPEGFADRPRWSPDGARIFYRGYNGELFSVDAEGGIPEIFEATSPDSKPRFYLYYYGSGNMVSPDGSTIVFSGTKEGVEGVHLWLISTEGGEPRRLLSSPPSWKDCNPCWSPAGDSVAFTRVLDHRDSTICNIFIVSAEGGEPRQLTSDADSIAFSAIAWSPDGKTIAYRSYQPTEQEKRRALIKTIAVADGISVNITDVTGAYVTTSLAWSPDGTRIAYDDAAGEEIGAAIKVISLGDSTISEVETGLEDASWLNLSWSPDGKKIAFRAYIEGDNRFLLMEDFLPEDW